MSMPTAEGISHADIASSRRMGAVLVVVAVALAWLCIYDPIQEARHGAESISTSLKGVILIPYAYILGPTYLLFPGMALRLFGLPHDRKGAMYALSVLLGAAGFLLYWLLSTELKAMGYE